MLTCGIHPSIPWEPTILSARVGDSFAHHPLHASHWVAFWLSAGRADRVEYAQIATTSQKTQPTHTHRHRHRQDTTHHHHVFPRWASLPVPPTTSKPTQTISRPPATGCLARHWPGGPKQGLKADRTGPASKSAFTTGGYPRVEKTSIWGSGGWRGFHVCARARRAGRAGLSLTD